MPLWMVIARGPIFRFALAVFVLGLLRLLLLTLWGMLQSVRQAGDQRIPYGKLLRETLSWIFPFGQLVRTRRIYSFASFGMHLGILGAAIFLGNHLDILRANIGLAWPAIFKPVLDGLSVITILAGIYLLLYRIYVPSSQKLSKRMDYLLLILILNLFISGYVAGQTWNPIPYDGLMLFHTLNGLAIALLAPFTKIAHCVLFPLIRLGSEIAWRLTPQGGSRAVRTLYGPDGRRI
jgi:nitrate reductase gamma subunit